MISKSPQQGQTASGNFFSANSAGSAGSFAASLSVITDGTVTLDGLSSLMLKVDGNINLEPNSGNGISLSVRMVEIDNSASFIVTFTNGTNLINETATALVDGDTISFRDTVGTLPGTATTEIRDDVVYFVISQATNSFQVSHTEGGSAITFTDDGTPTNSYKVCTLEGSTPTSEIDFNDPRELIPQALLPLNSGDSAFLIVINNNAMVADIMVNSGYLRYFN